MNAGDSLGPVLTALEGGAPVAEVVVVQSDLPGVAAGARLLVWADRAEGGLGDAELDREAVELARRALRERRPLTHEVARDAGRCTLFVEAHAPPAALVIIGAGHIARPLCHLGALLGFRVTVLDDRPEFASRERFPEAERVLRADFADPLRGLELGPDAYLVLVTRGHKYDFEVLLDLLQRPRLPAYVGMVGSRRRVRAALAQLAREGVPADRLGAVHAPVGLDIGAETPEEIAVSIAAELVRTRRGGTGAPLRDQARVADRLGKR